MDRERPFSGPISVSLAGLTLLALAAASFTSGLTRQLRLPRPTPETPARVVVVAPKPATSPPGALAYMATQEEPPPKPARRLRRHPRAEPPPVTLPVLPEIVAPAAPPAAPDQGVDAAASADEPGLPPPAPEAPPASP